VSILVVDIEGRQHLDGADVAVLGLGGLGDQQKAHQVVVKVHGVFGQLPS